MNQQELKIGDVVQLGPQVSNKAFAYCMMIVTEPKLWGAQGYIQALGKTPEAPGGQAYYRAKWDEMEFIGRSVWMAE